MVGCCEGSLDFQKSDQKLNDTVHIIELYEELSSLDSGSAVSYPL